MKALLICLLLLSPTLALSTNPESLPLVGGMPGAIEHTVTVGDLVYCASSYGLLVLDVADPAAIEQVSWLPVPGFAAGVAVQGDRACLAVWDLGLVVIDISDPAAPALLGICEDPARPGGVAISGSYAFVADMDLGFCVIDLGDPTTPYLAATLMNGEEYRGFDFVGDMAYLGSDAGSFYLIDVTDPLVPSLAGSRDFPGYVRGIEVEDGLAYLACGSYGLRVVDVSDPGDLLQLGHLLLEFDNPYGCFATEVAVIGGVAYVSLASRGLGLVDVGDPTAPVELIEHEVAVAAKSTEIRGDRAHVASANAGLAVIDVSAPAAPVDVGQHWLVGYAQDVVATDGRLWVAGGWATADEKAGAADQTKLAGQIRWADQEAGLFVVEDQRVIGYCSTGLMPTGLTLADELAYLPADFGGVRVQDVGDPTAPVEVAMIDTPVEHCTPAAADGYAYVLGLEGLHIYDMSDPEQPVEVGSCPASYYGDLIIDGDILYSFDEYPGLRVYDVSDRTAPFEIGSLDLPGGAHDAAVVGNHLYVANGLFGMTVVDVTDPSQPEMVGACDLPGYSLGVACRWPYAYVAAMDFIDEWGGLHVIDVSDPTVPAVVISNEIRGQAMAVSLDGPQVAVAAQWGGVMIFEHDDLTAAVLPQVAALLPNYPNPFNPRTTIRFDLPTTTQVSLTVYDLGGRRVRTLIDGAVPAGRRSVVWEGMDDHGRTVGAGVYLYRLETGAHRESRSMVLVR